VTNATYLGTRCWSAGDRPVVSSLSRAAFPAVDRATGQEVRQLHTWMPPVTVAAVSLLVAVPLRTALAQHPYRYDDERALPPRSHRWLVVALPVAGLAVAARWWTVGAGGAGSVTAGFAAALVGTAYCAMLPLLAALAAIDLDVHRLPDRLTGALTVGCAVAVLTASAAVGDSAALGRSTVAGAGLGVGYLVLRLLSPGRAGIGFGDVKLAPALGLLLGWVSWSAVVTGTLLAFVGGGAWACLLLVTRRARGTDRIAFGPFMILGTLIAIVLEGR
jgi:leader peptidase (prepilin peptidase) / N-methyltransferase